MPIRQLDPLLINQIAAGEVIERPASVIKEALENSLDAGATRLVIDIEEGGRELIRISDNGHGIPEDELPLALTRHATSKISSPEDLAAILTMGFRGEALASIASIARLTLTSRTPQSNSAGTLSIEGTQLSPITPASRAPGTTLEVRNLFFNTPARRRFMKAAPTEFGHIQRIVRQIAMAHEDVAFTLTHNGKKSLDLPSQSREARLKEIMGKDFAESAMVFEGDEQDTHVWGMVPHPKFAKANSRSLHYFINGRPFTDARITHAVREAFRGLMEPSKYPMAVLFLTMPPELVDVNVHPTKAEVRFIDSNRIHGLVLASLRQRLLAEDLTTSMELPGASAPSRPSTPMPGAYPGEFSDSGHQGASLPRSSEFGGSSGTRRGSSSGSYGGTYSGNSSRGGSTGGHYGSRATPPTSPLSSRPNQISWDDLRDNDHSDAVSSTSLPSMPVHEPQQASLGLNKAHLGPNHLSTPDGYLVIEDTHGLSILDPLLILIDLIKAHQDSNQTTSLNQQLEIFELDAGMKLDEAISALEEKQHRSFTSIQINRLLSFHRERLTLAPNAEYAGVVRMDLNDLEKLFKRS